VSIKVFVFYANGGLFEVIREIVEFDRSSILVVIDLVEEVAVSIENFGRNRVGTRFAEIGGRGEVFEEHK